MPTVVDISWLSKAARNEHCDRTAPGRGSMFLAGAEVLQLWSDLVSAPEAEERSPPGRLPPSSEDSSQHVWGCFLPKHAAAC